MSFIPFILPFNKWNKFISRNRRYIISDLKKIKSVRIGEEHTHISATQRCEVHAYETERVKTNGERP